MFLALTLPFTSSMTFCLCSWNKRQWKYSMFLLQRVGMQITYEISTLPPKPYWTLPSYFSLVTFPLPFSATLPLDFLCSCCFLIKVTDHSYLSENSFLQFQNHPSSPLIPLVFRSDVTYNRNTALQIPLHHFLLHVSNTLAYCVFLLF